MPLSFLIANLKACFIFIHEKGIYKSAKAEPNNQIYGIKLILDGFYEEAGAFYTMKYNETTGGNA